jgi:hypothetical protein
MAYEYREHEISARVWQSESTLYEIDSSGAITEEISGLSIGHEDQHIVWYEFEAVDPITGMTDSCVMAETLEEAKSKIDDSIKYLNHQMKAGIK